jgi:hypothetical protein
MEAKTPFFTGIERLERIQLYASSQQKAGLSQS